jgi:hypothetical protein
LDFLRANQNPDGGWGYFPGKQSWLEPTAWASIALRGDPASQKAWKLIASWQNQDGSCRPCAAVPLPNWTASLAVTVGVLQNEPNSVKRGASYLLGLAGEDSSLKSQIVKMISPEYTDRNPKFKGWPWKPGSSAWIEPTAHGITALRLANRMLGADGERSARIESAQSLILNQRCSDGGWNYGVREALKVPLTSFPETTGLAVIGLAGRKDAGPAVDHVALLLKQKQLPLATAWLSAALRIHGREVPPLPDEPRPDILLTAIEAVDWRLLA